MFGRRSDKETELDRLARSVETIETSEDFSRFADLLLKSLKSRPRDWENDRLDRYLDAIAAWSYSYDGYVKNNGSDAESKPWRFVATVLMAAATYE